MARPLFVTARLDRATGSGMAVRRTARRAAGVVLIPIGCAAPGGRIEAQLAGQAGMRPESGAIETMAQRFTARLIATGLDATPLVAVHLTTMGQRSAPAVQSPETPDTRH